MKIGVKSETATLALNRFETQLSRHRNNDSPPHILRTENISLVLQFVFTRERMRKENFSVGFLYNFVFKIKVE